MISLCFPNWKWNWRDDIQRESQAVLDSIKENDFHVLLKHEKNDGIVVYVPKETILNERTAKINELSQHFFFDLVQELSNTPHITLNYSEWKAKISKLSAIFSWILHHVEQKYVIV
jgi:hypothetical protein